MNLYIGGHMKDVLRQIFKVLPKKGLIAVALIAAILGVTSAARAWFPNRPTYTVQIPSDHVTFDSITNNPDEGDERAFFEVKDAANTQPNGFSHTVNNLKDGQDLLLRMYVHNDAADNLNGTNFDGKGVAKDTKVRIFLPTANANALRANAYISASNASPAEVADTINLGSNGNFNLTYENGSAVQYTNAVPTGMKLSDSIVSTGAPIGFNKLDGIVPGCFNFSSIVTIKVKVHKPSFSVTKAVRFEGQTSNDWKKSVTANPDQTVEWRIAFNNTGSTQLGNVTVLDQVPNGLTVVPGSVKLYNTNSPNGFTVSDSSIQANGRQVNVNIGTYNPNSNAFVLLKTKTPASKDMDCGTKQFTNEAFVTPSGQGTVNDTANVNVNGPECKKPQNPAFSCDSATITTIGDRQIRVNVNTTAINGAKVTSFSYNFGDGTAPLLTDQNPVEHTFANVGDFNVHVTTNFDVNGKVQTVDSDKCASTVSFASTTITPPTTPTKLVNTGPGDVLGVFTGTSLAGAFLHRKWLSRRGR